MKGALELAVEASYYTGELYKIVTDPDASAFKGFVTRYATPDRSHTIPIKEIFGVIASLFEQIEGKCSNKLDVPKQLDDPNQSDIDTINKAKESLSNTLGTLNKIFNHPQKLDVLDEDINTITEIAGKLKDILKLNSAQQLELIK